MSGKARSGKRTVAYSVAMVGIMAATVECGKLALALLPNVEVVTILLALYGYCFGALGVLAAAVFVCIEPIIWGFNTWVLTYFLYWPTVPIVFAIFRRMGIKNRFVLTLAAVLMTVWFGVLSSLVDVGLFSGAFDNFFYRFGIYYIRGIWFYVTQIVCNLVLFLLLFPFMARRVDRLAAGRWRQT